MSTSRAFRSTFRGPLRGFPGVTTWTRYSSFVCAGRQPHVQQTLERTWPQTQCQRLFQNAQRRHYAHAPFQYQRFKQTSGIFRRWAARPTFYYEIGGIGAACGGFYAYNLETVPVSGRRRFNIISAETEASLGKDMYNETMQEFGNRILPPHSKEHRLVQRVLDRLIPHSGIEDANWEIFVIKDDAQTNAFVIPGGKVFVFTGILRICQGEDGLATVLGHEIAHNVAHHAAERMSLAGVLLPIAMIGSLLIGFDMGLGRMLAQVAFTLPGSRTQETEADHIGLLMMAQSCYDPSAALGIWSRMEQEEKAQGQAIPQFISTHPSSHNRLGKIQSWLPEAEKKRESSDCAAMGHYARDFKKVVDYSQWPDMKP